MGFSILSYQVIGDEEIQKLAEVQVEIMKSDHEIVIVSKNSAIDSKLFPNCIVSKKESKQQDQNEKDNQVEDYKLTQPQFKIPSNFSIVEKQAILQIIGIALHKFKIYAHLLPMIFGYSAYLIYQQMLYSNAIDPATIYQSAGKSILNTNQQIYNDAVMSTNFQNFFELPVHLLKIFEFNDTNKFIFQQMCDVSYLFKAQYFAVFSAFFPLENAVMSQSSRSGKTVTLHTIFYFNLFSGLKIPILINTGFTKDSHDLKTQPLYNRGSIEMDQKLKTLFSAYQSQTDLGDVISSNLKDGVEYSKTMAYVKTECFNLIKTYDMHTAQQQLDGAFELYLQGTSVFCEFSVTGLLDFFKFDPSKQLEQTKKIVDDEIQASANKLEAAKKIIGTLNQEDSIQNQKDIIRAIELELELLTQRKNSYTAQKTQSRLVSVDSYNYSKEVILLVDECLSQQKASYASCTSALVEITNEFVDKFMENAKSSIEEVVKKVKLQSSEQVEQLLNWLEMREHNSKADPVDYNNKSLYLKEADQKITQIISDPTEVQRYFLTLIPSKLFTKCKAYEIIDLMGISSPNFINLRESQTVKESFQEMMSDLTRYSTLEVFREKLYQFLLMLYNPRGIETIFWRNISFVMNQGADTISSFHKSIEVKDKLNDYIGRKLQDEQKLIEFFIEEFGVNIIFPDDKVYTEIPFISVKVTHLLTAGTDLALINFLRQNQFLYTSENSRGKTPYTQSNILGTSQMHPSCLTQSYYRDMRITTQTNKSMIEQVKRKVRK
ncbi:uncharacterized protein SS50377_28830 [Spironucleus salmonicida]|uniref:Uncharacterized protein n=1 Tax=Spironucleus salmonicida TaxID=348837 RepID=A0A9P8RUA2_9EUKA|nr:hypothetical protein SS50377_28830 [Spironucleus salmonicida]